MPRLENELRFAFVAWLRGRLGERRIPEARFTWLLRRDEGWLARFERGASNPQELDWIEAWDLIALLGYSPTEVLQR